jgi:hypothetical protein
VIEDSVYTNDFCLDQPSLAHYFAVQAPNARTAQYFGSQTEQPNSRGLN